jgi:CBS domain-containing protein
MASKMKGKKEKTQAPVQAKVSDCMKREVVSLHGSATIGEAAARFVEQHIGMLPIVDDEGRLVGLLSLGTVLALVMPDFVRLVEDFDFVEDFGAVEMSQPTVEALARPVKEVMEPPESVKADCGLLRAFALLRHHDMRDLPVVDADNRLVGIASRVDIGTALLERWQIPGSDDK